MHLSHPAGWLAGGQLVSDGTRSFTWDACGHLSAVTIPADAVEYEYDPLARRSGVHDGTHSTGFLFDGATLGAQAAGAAVAEHHGAVVLHYDADFEHIAEITGQLRAWIIPRGQ